MDYSDFTVDDFAADDEFIRWVTQPDKATNQFWERFMAANPRQVRVIEQARRLVLQLEREQQNQTDTDEVSVRRMWQHIEQETRQVPVRRLPAWRSYGWYAAAASVVLLLGTFWWFNQRNEARTIASLPAVMRPDTDESQLADAFKTVRGPQSVLLTDGSRVQLSANSSLRFPAQFDTRQREVYLIGDAFFDVARRPQQPFLVHTNEVVTKVLGTSFWVKTNADNRQVSVDVRTGKVAVYVRHASEDVPSASQFVTLTPNQKAVYAPEDEGLSKEITSNPIPLKTIGKLDFDEAPIEQVFTAIEQLYGIPIDYDRDQLATCTLTTSIEKLPLFDQLKLVCRAINATYQQKDGHITVTGGGCH